MKQEPYYLAYEKRYRAVYAAGGERWGHAPDDADLAEPQRGYHLGPQGLGRVDLFLPAG